MKIKKILLKTVYKKYIIWIIFIALLCGSIFLRCRSYGDPSLSIGTVDTPVFISSAQADLDYHFLETGRPPTLPLLYKLLQPASGYNLTAISKPSTADSLKDLQFQPGFDQIVLVQMIISIIAWSTLAFVLFSRYQNIIVKFTVVILILAFAYSPQLAEWDRILLSESLSFSLFALLLALTIELAFRFTEPRTPKNYLRYIVGVMWFLVLIFWIFTRDANAYLIPVTIIIGVFMLLRPAFRGYIISYLIVGVVLVLSATFYLQQVTMRSSQRWVLPFLTNISMNVLPYPDRVDFFESLGMPVSEDLMQLQSNMGGEAGFYQMESFMDWAIQDGTDAYIHFLVEYPLWATLRLYDDLELLFSENLQPWFTGPKDSHPMWLIRIGDMLHPKSSATVIIDVLLSIMVILLTLRSKDAKVLPWAWIAVWLFFGEMVLLFISYHGDARSTIRHTLVASMPLRMSIWMLIMLVFDIAYAKLRARSM